MDDSELLKTRAGEAAALLKAMSNPNRLLILCMLSYCQRPKPIRYLAAPGTYA